MSRREDRYTRVLLSIFLRCCVSREHYYIRYILINASLLRSLIRKEECDSFQLSAFVLIFLFFFSRTREEIFFLICACHSLPFLLSRRRRIVIRSILFSPFWFVSWFVYFFFSIFCLRGKRIIRFILIIISSSSTRIFLIV